MKDRTGRRVIAQAVSRICQSTLVDAEKAEDPTSQNLVGNDPHGKNVRSRRILACRFFGRSRRHLIPKGCQMPTSFEREATTPDPSKSSVGPGLRRLPARYTGQCPARAWTWGLLSSSRSRGRRGVEESVGFRLCMQGCSRPRRLGKTRFVIKASRSSTTASRSCR